MTERGTDKTTDFSENTELIKKAQSGDREAMSRVVEKNMGLVKSIVPRFADRGTEYDDLVQIGTMGMIKAIHSFDASYNTVFSTYAVPLIIGELRRFLRDDGLIKVSRSVKQLGMRAMREKDAYVKEHGDEPSISQLCTLCQTTREELVFALEASLPVHSLAQQVGEDETMTLEGTIPEKENAIENLCDTLSLKEALRKLEPIERKIIYLRYFSNMSQQQCADRLGLSQVKVSRQEKKIFEKLRGELLK